MSSLTVSVYEGNLMNHYVSFKFHNATGLSIFITGYGEIVTIEAEIAPTYHSYFSMSTSAEESIEFVTNFTKKKKQISIIILFVIWNHQQEGSVSAIIPEKERERGGGAVTRVNSYSKYISGSSTAHSRVLVILNIMNSIIAWIWPRSRKLKWILVQAFWWAVELRANSLC